jgi:hypothetical protein
MFAYSFGNPTDPWNQKQLNSPLPCQDGIFCTRPICCYSVHPGEEGIKRKFFPGRSVVDRVTGKTVDQPSCVRLVGKDKSDVPGYYRRRTAKMSWPAWCAQEGIPVPARAVPARPVPVHPVPARSVPARSVPARSVPAQSKPEHLIREVLPNWVPPSLTSPIFRINTAVEVLLEHFRLEDTPTSRRVLETYQNMVECVPSDMYRDALYMDVISLAKRWPTDHPLQPQLRIADTMLTSQLFHAHVAEGVHLVRNMGDQIYAKAVALLKEVEADARRNRIWVESFTPGKATGMIMESLGKDSLARLQKEGNALLNDETKFMELIVDCHVEYSAFLEGLAKQPVAESSGGLRLCSPRLVRASVLAMAEEMMEYIKEEGRSSGISSETFTAEVATEMLMRHGTDEMYLICEDKELFFQRAVECLIEHSHRS